MSMYNPSLIYGVNLGKLDRQKRLRLPEGVVSKGEDELDEAEVDDQRLEKLAGGQGLTLAEFSGEDSLDSESKLDRFYVGVQIKEKREGDFGDGMVIFDINQICELRQNPSGLVEKMRAIGLNAKASDLRLYGDIWVD